VLAALTLALALAAAALCGPLCAPARALRWARPVLGAVTRGFDVHGSPFAAGRHRGVDLAAPPGTAVGAPCSGRVVVAGRVGASGRVVTVACGRWHASVLPLASIAVRRGAHVTAGRAVATAAGIQGRHAGLHFGVRRAGERFGYVDPLRFMLHRDPWSPVGPPPGIRARGERTRRAAPERSPAPRLVPLTPPAPAVPPRAAGSRPVAPWPVWAGVALLLAGASTGGVVRARRRRSTRLARLALPRSTPSG
jgi:hypothetical protein